MGAKFVRYGIVRAEFENASVFGWNVETNNKKLTNHK